MEKEKIRALIEQKIAGQGTMVDLGNALPEILTALVEDSIGDLVLRVSEKFEGRDDMFVVSEADCTRSHLGIIVPGYGLMPQIPISENSLDEYIAELLSANIPAGYTFITQYGTAYGSMTLSGWNYEDLIVAEFLDLYNSTTKEHVYVVRVVRG